MGRVGLNPSVVMITILIAPGSATLKVGRCAIEASPAQCERLGGSCEAERVRRSMAPWSQDRNLYHLSLGRSPVVLLIAPWFVQTAFGAVLRSRAGAVGSFRSGSATKTPFPPSAEMGEAVFVLAESP